MRQIAQFVILILMRYQYKREPLTPDEANRLANACSSHEEKLVTGMRVAELAKLTHTRCAPHPLHGFTPCRLRLSHFFGNPSFSMGVLIASVLWATRQTVQICVMPPQESGQTSGKPSQIVFRKHCSLIAGGWASSDIAAGSLVCANVMFCDFGTSEFFKHGSLRARNRRVSLETVLRILDDQEITSLFYKNPIPDIIYRRKHAEFHDRPDYDDVVKKWRENGRFHPPPTEIMEDHIYAQECFQLANSLTKLWRSQKGLPPLLIPDVLDVSTLGH